MKKLAVALVSLTLLATAAFAASHRNITSGEARSLLAKSKRIFLLDVRTPEEFRQARLKGAVLMPMNEMERRFQEVPRNRPVVVYCAVGSRSTLVAGFLAGKGYPEVYNMSDGLVGWYRNGFPLER